jgi:NADH-quinone oxidoreductase subunit N
MLDYYENEKYLILEIPFIMLMSIEGMFLLLISNDLFLIYLALELQSLSLYILAATKRYSNLSIEAGFKYFIYGSFASGLMLFGISFIYGFVGSTNLLVIYTFLSVGYDSNIMPILGHIFILGGILFKLGLVPFHN